MKIERPKKAGRSDNPDRKKPKAGKIGRSGKPEKHSSTERSERSAKPARTVRSAKTEHREKPEKSFKPERSERSEKPGRPVKTERSERFDKPERTARPERSERYDKPERTARPERSERFDKPERSGRPEKSERFEKPERPYKPGRSSAGEKPERYEKPERSPRPERAVRSERRDKPQRTIKFDKNNLPERADKPKKAVRKGVSAGNPEFTRLNKYIANSGICSRREADRLIEAGAVSVNGQIVTELGIKVGPDDKVQYGDQTINREKLKYVLLNKPKGYITTVDDPDDRKTVMALVQGACKERIYPVGRLDRNTTGLLLFTNDGMIAKKLTHPRYGIKKIYHVEIDKSLTRADFVKIEEGFRLEEDIVKVDAIEYIGDGKDKKQIGIELHSGQNRIVRRIFEHFEYKVLRLDRVYYAGLTKKNLPRGHWRLLDEQEINLLKMISSKP